MSQAVVNQQVMHIWELKDSDDNALTGLAGNMSVNLTRFPTATSSEAATETVSINEIGTTGFYTFIYTPTLAYTYVGRVQESSLFLDWEFADVVSDAPTAAAASAAYCSEADVAAIAQTGDYTSSTVPTENQVLLFMQSRAAEIYNWMREEAGTSAPGPSSYSVTINTGSDVGLALEALCRIVNATGAAADALQAAGESQSEGETTRVEELKAAFYDYKELIQKAVTEYIGQSEGSWAKNHLTEGRVKEGTLPEARDQQGFVFDDTVEW